MPATALPAMLFFGAIVLAVSACQDDAATTPSAVAVTFTPTTNAPAATPFETPTATSAPTEEPTPPPASPPARLRIAKTGVDAAIEVRGVDEDRVMENPSGPWTVAWYDFSAMLGAPGNAVFSGYVDYINVGRAVFFDLSTLAPGDSIEAVGQDGLSYWYRVIWSRYYPSDATSDQLQEIVGETPSESMSLITPGGAFNPSTQEYDQRLVVRAERMPAP